MNVEIALITKKLPRKAENIKKMEDEIWAELDNIFVVDHATKPMPIRISEKVSEQVLTHFTLGGIAGVFCFALGYDRNCLSLIHKQTNKWLKNKLKPTS